MIILSFLIAFISCSTDENTHFSEITKVALRDVGHHLLLYNQDSTSIVKPIRALTEDKYLLTFENELIIHPDSLVNAIKNSFDKAKLPQYYLVEVRQCEDEEVAYSYEMKQNVEKGIVPCGGRQLHKKCYSITVRFTTLTFARKRSSIVLYIIGLFVLFLSGFLIYYKKRARKTTQHIEGNFATLGRFKFYPEQNKLIKEAVEISLSKKECEILEILVQRPNQIVKREEITKKVWEDNGVVVGRSLDTYISKLRKKLKDDDTIKLINVHGVGYKLIME